MSNKCVLITAIPDTYKEWISSTMKGLQEQGSPVTEQELEKAWTAKMVENDKSGLMKYIASPNRGVRTPIEFNGSKPVETLVLGVKSEGNKVIVATTDGVYTFENGNTVSKPTATGLTVNMPVMEDIRKQSEASISDFNVFTSMSSQANKWASDYLLIGLANKSGGIIGPLIRKAHTSAKSKSNLYRDTVNLIDKGVRDSEFLAKMKVTLKISGDLDDKALADVITVAYNNARRTKEVLDTQLPELDKRIKREIRSSEDRKKLNEVFGRSGFMHLFDNKDIIAAINKGTSIDKLISMIPHTAQQLKEAEDLSNYLMNGTVSKSGMYNSESSTVTHLAALLSLKEEGRFDLLNKIRANNPELFVEMLRLSGMVKSLHEAAYKGKRNTVGTGSGKVYTGYDGHGMLDVYEGTHEYKYVNEKDLNDVLKDPRWKLVRKPENGNIGIVYRESLNSYQEGLGLDKDVIRNGIPLDTNYVNDMIKMYGSQWLSTNNVVSDIDNGYKKYRVVLNRSEKEAAGYMDNIAHTLYRTWVHNAQLVEMQTVQEIVTDQMTANGDAGLEAMEKSIAFNNKTSNSKLEIKPFINSELTYDEIKTKYPEVYKRYTPVKNISNYGDMRTKVTYVRKDLEDVVIGYSTGSIFKDDSTFGVTLQRVETVYKQLVQMVKLKMVVANPAKLLMDSVSNTTLLMSMDVGIDEIAKGYPEALAHAKRMSELEGRLVSAKLRLAQAEAVGEDTKRFQREVDVVNELIKRHPFSPAISNGFIQSQGTSMLIKEYDTISGLQKSIDNIVELVMKDKKGNPTKVHDGVVKLMNFGFGVDDIINSVSNMSKVKGTSFGEELAGIADRLAEKKGKDVIKAEEKRLGRKLTEDEIREIQSEADTVRYVSEFIAAPSSELVRQGSRVMQMADIMARWTLYKHEMVKNLKEKGYNYVDHYKATKDIEAGKLDKKVYESIENAAAVKGLDTFIDYRLNLPKELKVLSDLGVIMFPSFWLRAQKVIYNLVKYHPINAGAGLVVTDVLNLNGASIIDANVLNKMSQGTLIQAGQDVLSPGTIILGL